MFHISMLYCLQLFISAKLLKFAGGSHFSRGMEKQIKHEI